MKYYKEKILIFNRSTAWYSARVYFVFSLFNVYSVTIFGKTLVEGNEGIRVNGQQFNNSRYADDMG